MGNKEKYFVFHFGSFFRSWDNRILTFRSSDVSNYQSMNHEAYFTEWLGWSGLVWSWNLASLCKKHFMKNGQETSFKPFLRILCKKESEEMKSASLCKKHFMKNGQETSFKPFLRILCKKESEEVCMLILTKFESFSITYLI